MFDSLINGFFISNGIGRFVVVLQLVGSVVMFAAIIGKSFELSAAKRLTTRFIRDFSAGSDVLDYYLKRRPTSTTGVENIYSETCERLLKMLNPDVRAMLSGRGANAEGMAALSNHEVELVRGTCEHALDDAEKAVESGMTVIATVVALAPMLGLLGTVWGVLDAFAEMGTMGSANLATIAPSISSALVTTVVGLLVAFPGVIAFNAMNSTIRDVTGAMERFADELNGRVACEFQGRTV